MSESLFFPFSPYSFCIPLHVFVFQFFFSFAAFRDRDGHWRRGEEYKRRKTVIKTLVLRRGICVTELCLAVFNRVKLCSIVL